MEKLLFIQWDLSLCAEEYLSQQEEGFMVEKLLLRG